jgi:hypothetical protein
LGSRKRNGKSPEETVPTRDRILRINHYFSEKPVLIRKKSCNLAGFLSPGNLGQFTDYPEEETQPGARCCPKNEYAGNLGLKWIFSGTGEI